MPKAELQYLTDELNSLREQKLYQKLRILETEQLPIFAFRRPRGHQPFLQQLSGIDHASQASPPRPGGHGKVGSSNT